MFGVMEAALDLGKLLEEAFVRHSQGDIDGAMVLYRRVLSADPRDASAHKGLGVALCQTGALGRGTKLLRRACELDPEDAECWTNLANACLATRDVRGCANAARKAIELDPSSAVAQNNLAAALRADHDLDGSFRHAQEAVRLEPGFAQAHLNLGAVYQGAGATREARECFAQASLLDPHETMLSESYLFSLHYDEQVTPEQVFEAHRAWGSTQLAPPRPAKRAAMETVGFVSGDLRGHPVGRFFLPFLRHFSQTHRVVLYSNNSVSDAVTEEFKGLPVEWRDIVGVDAPEAAEAICRDGVDVLFDLSGHTASNRLDVFALRPAPVQVTWLGYSATTGLPAMDWFLGDRFVFLDGSESLATERLARLETAFLVDDWEPSSYAEAERDCVRIGVTNNPAKLSDGFLACVAQILSAAPDAKLCFKYGSVDCDLVRSRVRDAMSAHKVDMSRLEFVGALPPDEHAAFLAQLDFCLDTFPYNGATTTMDALKVGTPVLTLSGRSYCSRMTGSLLHHIGFDDLVTTDRSTFITSAVSLARNPDSITESRRSLADKFAGSVLVDSGKFSAAFAATLADMWANTGP